MSKDTFWIGLAFLCLGLGMGGFVGWCGGMITTSPYKSEHRRIQARVAELEAEKEQAAQVGGCCKCRNVGSHVYKVCQECKDAGKGNCPCTMNCKKPCNCKVCKCCDCKESKGK
jgi:hypothetical protein